MDKMTSRRTTRNTNMDTPQTSTDSPNCERLLQDISEKMTTLCEKLGDISGTMSELSLQMREQKKILTIANTQQVSSQNHIVQFGEGIIREITTLKDNMPAQQDGNGFTTITVREKLDEMQNNISHLANYELIDQTNQLRIEEEAYRTRRRMLNWQKKINQRKQNYYNFLKTSKLCQLYTDYQNPELMYLPQKFRPL